MKKVLALNSGGFDSVLLINELVKGYGYDVVSVFFNYGQRNLNIEAEKARKLARKLNLEHIEIQLSFDWVQNDLMFNHTSKETEGNQYIPSRNTIFLSNVISIAEAKGIKDIYVAFIQANPGSYFPDCSPEYVENFNKLLEPLEIKIHAPYIEFNKYNLIPGIRTFHVKRDDVITCNTPINGEGCQVCPDCKIVNNIFDIAEAYLVDDLFINNGFKVTEEVLEALRDTQVISAKLCFNNVCNFSCKHCLFGSTKVYPTKKPVLGKEDWLKVIDILVDNGIQYIDFFGKEPLVNDDVFYYIDYLKTNYPNINYSMISNGKNVPKYIDLIEKYVPKIALSLESLKDVRFRDSSIRKNIELLLSRGVEVSISFDLFDHNYMELPEILEELYNLGIRRFFAKPIVPLGNKPTEELKVTSPETIINTLSYLSELELYPELQIDFLILNGTRVQLEEYKEFVDMIEEYEANRNNHLGRVNLQVEYMCDRFRHNIFIMPDGEVLGCGNEVCNPNYDKASGGNILEDNFKDIITKGKDKSIKYLRHCKKQGCYHSPKFLF